MACDNGVQMGETQSKRVMAPLWVLDTEAEEKRVKGIAARKVARAKSTSGGSRADAVGGSREGRGRGRREAVRQRSPANIGKHISQCLSSRHSGAS